MNPFNTALFKSPKWSTFPHEASNKISWSIGNLVPIKKYFLDAGDRIQVDLGQLTRFNPLQAPVMDQYDLTIDAFFVAARVLQSQVKDGVFTKFWNYSINLDGTYQLPMKNAINLLEEVNASLPFDCPLSESLYEYLGYPTFSNAFDLLMDWYPKVMVSHDNEDSENYTVSFDWLPTTRNEMYVYLQNFYNFMSDEDNSSITIDSAQYRLNNSANWTDKAKSHPFVYTFIVYLLRRYYGLELNFNSFSMFTASNAYISLIRDLRTSGSSPGTDSVIDWTKYFNYKKIDVDSVFKGYYNYLVYGLFLECAWSGETVGLIFYGLAQTLSGLDPEEVNDIYLRAYWRIVADWYTNLNVTGFTNDEQYAMYIYGETSGDEGDSSSDFINHYSSDDGFGFFVPFKRNWKNDYFTSAFPNPQSGSAVNIPTNGTITDLRASAIWQKIKEVAMYAGKRAIDTWRAVRGVKSSNARYDMSEPLKRVVFNVDINAITQTNQSDINSQLKSPVASWSGQGVSAGSRHFIDYISEEPGIIMILASLTPRASYYQGLDKFLTKGKSLIDDYVYPEMAKVGEQPIKRSELFYDVNIDGSSIEGGTFGYTRRYAEFMFDRSEVHGEFKTSLNYWHSARKFDTAPSLGTDFLQVDTQRDNLNRVFATSNSQNVYSYFFFDARVVRALPKFINYGF